MDKDIGAKIKDLYYWLEETFRYSDHTIYYTILKLYLHTHIIGHYNPSVRITALLLTPLMLCAFILYVSGGTYSLTSTPNDRFFRNFFMAVYFSLRVFARNLLRGSHPKNILHISFLMTDLGYEPRFLSLISRHTTYQTTVD